jgi:hypothetical protein
VLFLPPDVINAVLRKPPASGPLSPRMHARLSSSTAAGVTVALTVTV